VSVPSFLWTFRSPRTPVRLRKEGLKSNVARVLEACSEDISWKLYHLPRSGTIPPVVIEDRYRGSGYLYPLCLHCPATRRIRSGYCVSVRRAGLSEPRTSMRTFPRPGSIQDSERPAWNGTICYASRIAGIVHKRAQLTHQAHKT